MTLSRANFFNEEAKDEQFNQLGYLIDAQISTAGIKKLIALYDKLNIPDSYGFGFNVGLNTNEKEKRRIMQDEITAIIEDEVIGNLNNKYVFTATFMNKVPEGTHLLPPHQDWTFTDERINDSVMCWIPLTDVDEKNGCMTFVPYSNQIFNYIRPFPFPFELNPVHIYSDKLLGLMKPEPMKAGEMVFINHKTAHASFPNSSANNRLAIGLSIAPKNAALHVYCLNPENKGKTILKYAVDKYFLVNHNHPSIDMQYRNNLKYDFLYQVIDEIDYDLPKMSWEQIADYFKSKGLTYNETLFDQQPNNSDKATNNETPTSNEKNKKNSWFLRLLNYFKHS